MSIMHPEDEANADAPLVPAIPRPTRTPTTNPRPGPTPVPTGPDPLQPDLAAIRGQPADWPIPSVTEGRR